MKATAQDIRDFLDTQAQYVTHYLVAHSNYSAYHKSTADIVRMTFNLRKDFRHARNCFNRELYGNGARRKPLLQTLWTYCWVDKAQQKNDIYITEPLANTQSHLLHYGTKEAQFGNTSCWDFENTQIPYSALNAD